MCQVIGLFGGWGPPLGLLLDVIGVLLLGFDLIRVQRLLRVQARNDITRIDAIAEEYGGIDGWIQDIERGASWIREHQYSDHHVEDEVSYNARRAIDHLKELSQCVNSLVEHTTKIVELQKGQADGNALAANKSLRFSFIGLGFIIVGFLLQLLGAVGC